MPNTAARFERNAQESPFLRLPTEVREKIYCLVIGGHHVQYQWTQLLPTHPRGSPGCPIWGLSSFCLPNAPRLSNVIKPNWQSFSWSGRFNNGKFMSFEPVSRLSDVCRQLHQDTALLYYSMNLFSFDKCWIMENWIATRKPVQLRAITKLCMPYLHPWLTKKEEKLFTGLEEVYIRFATKYCVFSWPPACFIDKDWVIREKIPEVIDYWKERNVQVYLVHDCRWRGSSCQDLVSSEFGTISKYHGWTEVCFLKY